MDCLMELELHPSIKQWSSQDLTLACKAVSDRWTIRRAAEEFGVPKSTLYDHVSGRIGIGARSGPPRYLSDKEEKDLVNFLTGCSKIGFAKSRKEVLAIVQAIVAKKRGRDIIVTTGWWNSFKKRHPQLTVRTASRLSYVRAIAHSAEIFNNYFDLLEQTLV